MEINEWHIGVLKSDVQLPDQWTHDATGSPAAEGLKFEFYWLSIDENLTEKLPPLFAETAKMIVDYER